MAGRAFRTQQILSSDREGRARLWVPVVDGADRVGVLEVGLPSASSSTTRRCASTASGWRPSSATCSPR